MRKTVRYVMLLLMVAGTGGCSAGAPSRSGVELGLADGLRWIGPDETEHYYCKDSILVCRGAVGRRSGRLCQCVAK